MTVTAVRELILREHSLEHTLCVSTLGHKRAADPPSQYPGWVGLQAYISNKFPVTVAVV